MVIFNLVFIEETEHLTKCVLLLLLFLLLFLLLLCVCVRVRVRVCVRARACVYEMPFLNWKKKYVNKILFFKLLSFVEKRGELISEVHFYEYT